MLYLKEDFICPGRSQRSPLHLKVHYIIVLGYYLTKHNDNHGFYVSLLSVLAFIIGDFWLSFSFFLSKVVYFLGGLFEYVHDCIITSMYYI